MANVKISQLTALAPPDAADLVPVTDSSASQTKRTTVGEIVGIVNGDVDVANDGTATISELPVSKLQDGTARQLLQTDAAGTGVEWTSNVDVPGTLDVTGAATLDSTLGVNGQTTLASAAVSDLTSGRVVLAGTSGELEDSAGLTFNGTQLDVDGNVIITGDLTVEGATTTLETETVKVEDKNIELGVVASPTDVTANGGGITLKGSTDKTINWVDSTDSWTSSEHVDLASGKSYRINGTEVLSSTTLGSGVTGSSLTSVGTLGSLTVTGSTTAGSFIPTSGTMPTNGLYLPGTNQIALSSNGSKRVQFGTGEVVFNDDGQNYDFRIEGDTKSNLFFVDASADAIGIGTNTPAKKLHLVATSAADGIYISNTTNGYPAASTGYTDIRGTFFDYLTTGQGGGESIIRLGSENAYNTSRSSYISFLTSPADGTGTATEKARITSAGRFGLGTTDPTALIDVSSDVLRLRTAKTPASATDAGNAGDICWDANYIYVCIATNTWKRSALSTW